MEFGKRKPVFRDALVWRKIVKNLELVPRDEAEGNPKFKQLVVYVLIRRSDQYLVYQRTKKVTEGRLRAKLAIGFGGHVSREDFRRNPPLTEDDADFTLSAVWRELGEEMGIHPGDVDEPRLIGFLNDDSISVNRDHFGLVWEVNLRAADVELREAALSGLRFCALGELKKMRGLESWSRLLVHHLREP
jgi:predicted NUDIX family phosphoesterase